VSDSKYRADISKGIILSAGGLVRTYAADYGWPDDVPGLGPHRLGTFARCEFCPPGIHIAASGTWTRYGDRVVCRACARLLLEAALPKAARP